MSWFEPAENLSPKTRVFLQKLAQCGQSEASSVADILNTIAQNDKESATDAFLVLCAEQIIEAAQAFIRQVSPPQAESVCPSAHILTRMQNGPSHWNKNYLIESLSCVPASHPLWGRINEILDEHAALQPYIEAAQNKQTCEELEIDENALISAGEDNGAYVQAWTWVEGRICGPCSTLTPKHWICDACGQVVCHECMGEMQSEETPCPKCEGPMYDVCVDDTR